MYERLVPLIGEDNLERLHEQNIILFGVGGVGGWCAEVLIRSGINHLTIVDYDNVARSNRNRQIVATALNEGKSKVEEMRKRLLAINPDVSIVAISKRLSATNISEFELDRYDYIIDAIDEVSAKASLLLTASSLGKKVFSSMGAARKLDASRVKATEFHKVEGCPLARALRHRFKHQQQWPTHKIQCVWSDEISADSGTIAYVVGIFGMRLAAEVIKDVIQSKTNQTL